MPRSKVQALIYLSFVFAILSVSFYNCAPTPPVDHVETGTSNSQSVPGLPFVNYFQSQPPASFSGEPGFNFLLKEYFYPQCGGCHDAQGMFSPKFANPQDPAGSYLAAKTFFRKSDMVMRITDNPFCRPFCSLDSRGEVYKAIIYWLDHR